MDEARRNISAMKQIGLMEEKTYNQYRKIKEELGAKAKKSIPEILLQRSDRRR